MSNLSTALAIAEAAKRSLTGEETVSEAMQMFITLGVIPTPENVQALLKYSAHLTADVATRLTSVFMTETEFNLMVADIKEMESLDGEING